MEVRRPWLAGLATFCLTAAASGQTAVPKAPPSSEEQAALVAEVRRLALDYSQSLPNFLCTQITRRSAAPVRPGGEPSWKLQDTLTIQLSFFEQKESYRVVKVNGKAVDKPLEDLPGFKVKSDFGSMTKDIFEPASETHFDWDHPGVWNGRPSVVLSFRMEPPHSVMSGKYKQNGTPVPFVLGCKGQIEVDWETRQVVGVTAESVDPPGSAVRDLRIAIRYGRQKIGNRDVLLPLDSVTTVSFWGKRSRTENRFTGYRMYSADSAISFDDPAK
jgi:hypothetical protein